MADRYGVPVPVLREMGLTLRDLAEFTEWEGENPGTQWWAEMAARAQGVKFERTPKVKPLEGQEDVDHWLKLVETVKGAK